MTDLRTFPKKTLWRIYWVCLVASLVLDFYWLYTHKFHLHFSFQEIPQFFALFGFLGCMLLILLAKALGFFIVREEDYYQKRKKGGR